MPAYIPDGYTQDGYIAERKGAWEPVRFQYRLLGYGERGRVVDSIGKMKPDEAARLVFETIKRQVLSWDVKESAASEKPLPVSVEVARRLHPELVDIVFNMVAGYRVSDPDPSSPEAEAVASAVNYDAIFGGTQPGTTLLESAEKNS